MLFSSGVFADNVISGRVIGVRTSEIATCESDGFCKLDCVNGDADCTCKEQSGFSCLSNQECKAGLLKNWDGVTCCSQECSDSELVDGGSLQEVSSLNSGKNKTFIAATKIVETGGNKGMQYSLSIILILFLAFVLFLVYSVHHFGEEVSFVVNISEKIKSWFKK